MFTTLPLQGGPSATLRPLTESNSVFAVYTEDWGLTSSSSPQLIMALWDDGRMIWSIDQVHGGAPYREGHVQPGALARLLAGLEHGGQFDDEKLSRSWAAWDSRFTTILGRVRGRVLQMRSGHELEPPVDNASLTPELAVEIVRYRRVWSQIREQSAILIPVESKPSNGKLVMERGVISWQESSL